MKEDTFKWRKWLIVLTIVGLWAAILVLTLDKQFSISRIYSIVLYLAGISITLGILNHK
ncbi:hypothetical protein ACFL15_00155 [Patescibacteria group bacterium]